MTALSQHFSLEEMVASEYAERRGIDNTPPPDVLEHLRATADALEDVRSFLGHPIIIRSGYRSPALNKAIGGATHSAHMAGAAADFICPAYGTPLQICEGLEVSRIKFDQLLYEGTWVHISFATPMRQEVLTAKFTAQGAQYSKGLIG